MKKNKKIILIIVLALIICAILISGLTYSRYVKKVEGDVTANIAKMVFKVNGQTEKLSQIRLFQETAGLNLINGKLAPGTDGRMEFILSAEGDVGVDYSISFENETTKPDNLFFMYDGKTYKTLDELSEDLTGNLPAGFNKEISIIWEWPFSLGENEDLKDTNYMDSFSTYSFDMIIKGSQAMPDIA